MKLSEVDLRNLIVEEALSWVDTPFHHHAMVKGAGVDCLHFIYAPYKTVGLIPDIEIPQYSTQWYANKDDERLIEAIIKCGGKEIQGPPKPADIVTVKVGRVFAHSGIVVDWPVIVTANPHAQKVTKSNASSYSLFANREKKFFSYW